MAQKINQIMKSKLETILKEIFLMLLMLYIVLFSLDEVRNGLVSYYFNLTWLLFAVFIVFLINAWLYRENKALLRKFGFIQIFLATLIITLLLFKTLSLGLFGVIITIVFIIFFLTFLRALY